MWSADDVEALVAEAEGIAAGDSLSLELDDRTTAAAIGPALEAIGFQPGTAAVHLAYLGGLEHTGHDPAGVRIEDVPPDEPALQEWATVKLQAFANSEAPPANDSAGRRAGFVIQTAMAGQGRALAARIEGESVAVAAFYEGDDRFVFVLGTRVPFRHLRIGRALLAHVVHDPGAPSCRSVVINADEGGRPEALYRRLGFTDEVHWRRPSTTRSSSD